MLIFRRRPFAWYPMKLSGLLLGIALHTGVTALARDVPPTSNIGIIPQAHPFPAVSPLLPLDPETRSSTRPPFPPTPTSPRPQQVSDPPLDAESDSEMDLVPYGFCAEQLEATKRELRLVSLAQRCLRSKDCILERDRLRLNTGVNGESLGDLLHSSPNEIHARPKDTHIHSKDIHATLDIQFSMRDWKRLAKWSYARDTSLLWGHPTLRLQMIDLLDGMEDSLERRSREGGGKVEVADGGEANQLDGEEGSRESDDLVRTSSHIVPEGSTSGDRSESPICSHHRTRWLVTPSKPEDCNGGRAIGESFFRGSGGSALSFGSNGDPPAPSTSQECPLTDSIRSKSLGALLSKIQQPPSEAQMCLLKPSQSLFSKAGPPTSRSLERDEYIVTFLDPLGSGKEAEVWRVCIHGKPNNTKTRSNQKAAAVNDSEPNQAKPAGQNHISSAEVSALKVYRRQFGLPRGRQPNSRKHSIKSPIPPFPVVWKKALASFMEAVEFGSVIPMDVAVVPLRAWNLEGSAFRMTSHQNSEPANRYTVYLGYAASFEVAEGDLSEFGYRFYDGRIPSPMLASLTEGLVRALKAVEATGHVWMDFKPENFLIVDGKPKIGDIGFMRPIGELTKLPGIGTPGFRPFEAFLRSSTTSSIVSSERAVFALGVTLYHLVFSRLPWSENDIRRLASHATRYQRYELDFNDETVVDETLKDLLQGLLHPNPRYRMKLSNILDHPYFHR